MSNIKQSILNNVSDLMSDFLYYDRREDQELPVHAIENAILCGEISVEEILFLIKNEINQAIERQRERVK